MSENKYTCNQCEKVFQRYDPMEDHTCYEVTEIESLKQENEKLREELNNSKLFHCPHYITTDNGYVACRLKAILNKEKV